MEKRTHGSNWPALPAVVDVVSVAACSDSTLPLKADSDFPCYLATLTYFYGNPEKHTGEYSRRFGDKGEAEAWANSYKGSTVTARVNPRDTSRSVVREEDL